MKKRFLQKAIDSNKETKTGEATRTFFRTIFYLSILNLVASCGQAEEESPAPGSQPNDQDCINEVYFADFDNDTFGDSNKTVEQCEKPEGFVAVAGDCNDNDALVNPNSPEVCDGNDNNCNGLIDDDPDGDFSGTQSYYLDEDGDGYGAGLPIVACSKPHKYVILDGDCDDSDSTVRPDADEICDGVDNDCDGGIDGTIIEPNQCGSFEKHYAGIYNIHAVERQGEMIVNEVDCYGTSDLEVKLSQSPALQGTVKCIYSGDYGFDDNQSGIIEAEVGVDGTLKGSLTHVFKDSQFYGIVQTFMFVGKIDAGWISMTGRGALCPNPRCASDWEVDFFFDAN